MKSQKPKLPTMIVCFLLATVFGFLGWYRLALRPAGNAATVSFTIIPGEGQVATAQRLKQAGLIRSQPALLIYLALHNLSSKLQSGTYSLHPNDSTSYIARQLTNGDVDRAHLTIPEGLTVAKIEQLVQGKGIKAADFEAAAVAEYNFDFLSSRPPGSNLEGYLFPDSYQIGPNTTARELIQSMLVNFGNRVDSDLRSGLAAQGFNLHQGLTLASIVEREVATPSDRAIVAGIFLRRLKSGQGLQSDVTVHYAADKLKQSFSTKLDSPYNTYLVKGLPPGPICNPGLGSLQAVAHPTSTDYVYFLAGKDGVTHYAKTLAEHDRNVQKYLR